MILASQSPRRKHLLQALGLEFEVIVSGLDEGAVEGESHRSRAMQTATEKAKAVARKLPFRDPTWMILAADTMVVFEDRVLGKPNDVEHAIEMLSELSGRSHQVITGMTLLTGSGRTWTDAATTEVTFNELDPVEVRRYAKSGDAADKAGAYGLQEVGTKFIAEIEGDLSNVLGLPLGALREGLKI